MFDIQIQKSHINLVNIQVYHIEAEDPVSTTPSMGE